MALTDKRNLKVKIFELVEQTTDNYSTVIEVSTPITGDEPRFLTEEQVTLANSVNMAFLNSTAADSIIDPRNNEDVRGAIKLVNALDSVSGGSSADTVARTDFVNVRSRLLNLVKAKDMILKNRFEDVNVIHTAPLSKFSVNINLESKTEIKFIKNYQQILRSLTGNEIGSYQACDVINAYLDTYGMTYQRQLYTSLETVAFIYSLADGKIVAELISQLTSGDMPADMVDYFNKLGAFLSEKLDFRNSDIKAYEQKLDFETDQRKTSFNIPFTDNTALNSISSRENSQKEFGFVIYDESKEGDLFETNSLGLNVLTSNDADIIEFGYILNYKEIATRGFNFNGVRTLLKTSPSLFHKRYIDRGSLDLNNFSDWSASEFTPYADFVQITQAFQDPSDVGPLDPDFIAIKMQQNLGKPTPSTDVKVNYAGTELLTNKVYRIRFTMRFRLFDQFSIETIPFVMVYLSSDPTVKSYIKPYPTDLNLNSKFAEDVRINYFDFVVDRNTQNFSIFASPEDEQVGTYNFDLGDFSVHEIES